MSKNDITGDSLVTKPATAAYQEGWERTFGKRPELETRYKVICDQTNNPTPADPSVLRVDIVLNQEGILT